MSLLDVPFNQKQFIFSALCHFALHGLGSLSIWAFSNCESCWGKKKTCRPMNQNDELRDFSNAKSLSVGCWVSVGLLGNSNSLTYKNSYESVLISIILHTGALRKALLTGWLDGWLVRPQLRLWGPPMFGKRRSLWARTILRSWVTGQEGVAG